VKSSEAESNEKTVYNWLIVAKQILVVEVSGRGSRFNSAIDSQATKEKHAKETQLLI
jgi:hypothetical protein